MRACLVSPPVAPMQSRSYGNSASPVQRIAAVLLVTIACAAALLAGPGPGFAAGQPVKIAVLGDSLTAGLGLPAAAAFPARLQQALRAKGLDVEIHDAGVSGDTASGGLARLDWAIPEDTQAVIVELGANDALRGIDPKITRAALEGILRRLKARGVAVLLAGMQAPRNLGADYAAAFDAIYPELAAAHDVLLYPFFLQGVATDAALNQGDGIHPNAAGVDAIVARIIPKVEELVARARQSRS